MDSNKFKLSLILPFLFVFFISFSGDNTLYVTNNGRVNFVSNAPLEIIKAASNKLAGILNIADKEFVFSVPMKSFEGFNSPLQKVHFNENYIESEKYPEAKFKGKIIEDIDFKEPGNYKVRAKGKFTVHGKENPMTIKGNILISKSEIQINAGFSVYLKDHDIEIPTIVNQKLAERIDVTVKLVLKPKK
jgi:hypothetical protein